MKKYIALVLALVCVLGLVGCSQQGQQDIITPTQNNEEISQTDIQSEAEQKYTYEELSEMPAEELLDLFIQNGLVISDELKQSYTEEELQSLFKEHFALWHTGVVSMDYTVYMDLAEQTKAIFDKIAIPNFSYAEDAAIYLECEPGVKTSGFVNTTETEITFENVAERAKNECTVEYNSITTYFDTDECVWKVHFCTDGMVGGDQSVYLDCDGKTVLIVYGE